MDCPPGTRYCLNDIGGGGRRQRHEVEAVGPGMHRQRTLRQTIAWSFDLLTPEQQRFFTQLGVFGGSCDLDALAAVTEGVLGGFTTYSALATDTATLAVTHPGRAVGYALATVLVGAVASTAGIVLARHRLRPALTDRTAR